MRGARHCSTQRRAERLLGLSSSGSSGTGTGYTTCQNRFPVLCCWGFPFKTTDDSSYFALFYFPEEKAHAKEVYTKRVEQMYSVCQYSIEHNELLNGKSKKENIKLHIKKIEKFQIDWLMSVFFSLNTSSLMYTWNDCPFKSRENIK